MDGKKIDWVIYDELGDISIDEFSEIGLLRSGIQSLKGSSAMPALGSDSSLQNLGNYKRTWETKIWEMPMVDYVTSNSAGTKSEEVPNSFLTNQMADILKTLPDFVERVTRTIAVRDEAIEALTKRVDGLSDRIVDLEQKIELLLAIEKNETFGMF